MEDKKRESFNVLKGEAFSFILDALYEPYFPLRINIVILLQCRVLRNFVIHPVESVFHDPYRIYCTIQV